LELETIISILLLTLCVLLQLENIINILLLILNSLPELETGHYEKGKFLKIQLS